MLGAHLALSTYLFAQGIVPQGFMLAAGADGLTLALCHSDRGSVALLRALRTSPDDETSAHSPVSHQASHQVGHEHAGHHAWAATHQPSPGDPYAVAGHAHGPGTGEAHLASPDHSHCLSAQASVATLGAKPATEALERSASIATVPAAVAVALPPLRLPGSPRAPPGSLNA